MRLNAGKVSVERAENLITHNHKYMCTNQKWFGISTDQSVNWGDSTGEEYIVGCSSTYGVEVKLISTANMSTNYNLTKVYATNVSIIPAKLKFIWGENYDANSTNNTEVMIDGVGIYDVSMPDIIVGNKLWVTGRSDTPRDVNMFIGVIESGEVI